MLQVTDLSVRYGGQCAVDRISMAIPAGAITAVIGPNGSGKSSLLKAMAGLIAVPRDHVRVTGRIGYMPQDIGARAALTVMETVLLGRLGQLGLRVSAADVDAVAAVLQQMQCTHLADRWLADLSGGQRQLVFLAQALAGDPTILLLDEPISALDLRHQLTVLTVLRRLARDQGIAVVVILHDITAAARFADRIAVLAAGRLVSLGPPTEVVTADMIATVFGVDAEVIIGSDGLPRITPRGAMLAV